MEANREAMIKHLENLRLLEPKRKLEKKYNYIIVNGYVILEHRYVWEKINGKIPRGMEIHHKNGNKKDNRIENLELIDFKKHREIHRLPGRIRKWSKRGYCKVIRQDENTRKV